MTDSPTAIRALADARVDVVPRLTEVAQPGEHLAKWAVESFSRRLKYKIFRAGNQRVNEICGAAGVRMDLTAVAANEQLNTGSVLAGSEAKKERSGSVPCET